MSPRKLSDRVARMAPSGTMAVGLVVAELKKRGIDVIDLGPGEPNVPTPAVARRAAQAAIEEDFSRYTLAAGIEPLRAAVGDWYRDRYGCDYPPDAVIITVGAKHAIFAAIQVLCDPGDEVVIPVPYWVSFSEQVKWAGATPVFVEMAETNGFNLDVDRLATAVTDRTKLVILNTPGNPTGVCYREADLRALAALARERDLYVLFDECYTTFVYDGHAHFSLARLPELQDRLILVNTASKPFSMTGWRIGYALGPRPVIQAMKDLQGHLTSNPNSIAQRAVLAAFRDGQGFIAETTALFQKRRDLAAELIGALPEVTCVPPQGAFYCFPNVSRHFDRLGVGDSTGFATRLLEREHVAVVSGVGFGADGYVRVSYALPEDRFREGMERIRRFLST